jgi:hypothetical protein
MSDLTRVLSQRSFRDVTETAVVAVSEHVVVEDFEFHACAVWASPGQLVVLGTDEIDDEMAVVKYAPRSGPVDWTVGGRLAYRADELEEILSTNAALLESGFIEVTTRDL